MLVDPQVSPSEKVAQTEKVTQRGKIEGHKKWLRTSSTVFLMLITLFLPFLIGHVYGWVYARGIYVADPIYKLPDNIERGSVSHTFRIYNLQPRRLTLQAEPSCGCISSSWSHQSVAPYHWTDFSATMKVGGMSPGAQKYVTFRTDSRKRPFLFIFFER